MEMTIRLNAPGMTSLHKAGLAGLYMTLRAFDEKGEKIDGLEWKLEATQVTLCWLHGKPKDAFAKLVANSFGLENGFVSLAGLESVRPLALDQKHLLNYALLHSFLQFGPENPTGNPWSLSYEVDNHLCWIKEFKPILKIRHQKTNKDFISESGEFRKQVTTKSWMYPGGIARHEVHSKATTLYEPVEAALALLYAPVGVIYYKINSRTKGRKARLAMVISEIRDLEAYAEVRQAFAAQGVLEMTASSASDAALRMLVTMEANSAGNKFAALFGHGVLCRVVTFGIVSWNEKQKTRTYTRSVFSGHLPGLANYRKAAAIFKNRWQMSKEERKRNGELVKPESYFVIAFTAREIIADNIAQGKVWYHDLATFLSNKEIRQQLYYERKEMAEMVREAVFDDENERLFIQVCHESWRRRMGKLGERAQRENASFSTLVRKEAEKLRTSLARCKNAETLRETVVDFWARAGSNEDLRGGGLPKLLPLFNEKNWRKARDLTLLALISYQPQSKEEAEALTVNLIEEGVGNDE
jgi:CRISPR-associated protein Cas8a1/Csx13